MSAWTACTGAAEAAAFVRKLDFARSTLAFDQPSIKEQ